MLKLYMIENFSLKVLKILVLIYGFLLYVVPLASIRSSDLSFHVPKNFWLHWSSSF